MVGQDDALVREYRQGDDVRRIHWRSTARWGDLMVRREEQAWDPSASIMLDSRVGAHAGRGMHNSLEWAISAAASIAHPLPGRRIQHRDLRGRRAAAHQRHDGPAQLRLDRAGDQPADRPPGPLDHDACTTPSSRPTIDRPGQLVVAIMGRMTRRRTRTPCSGLRRNRAQGLAMVLDVDTFADEPGSERQRAQHELASRDPPRQPVAGDRGAARDGRGRGLVGASSSWRAAA